MNRFSGITRNRLSFFAAVVCTIAIACGSAVAASDGHPAPRTDDKAVFRTNANGTYTGPCCSSWDESVTVNEPNVLVPIVVTWSTDYQSNAPFLAGLKLNDGACLLFGPASMTAQNPYDGLYMASATFQWVIEPGDYGLRKGRNVLTLCGGGGMGDSDSITIWGNTLAAHLQR